MEKLTWRSIEIITASIEMDLYHKNDAGDWVIINYQEGDMVELQSINLSFPIEQVYRGLVLTPAGLPSAAKTLESD